VVVVVKFLYFVKIEKIFVMKKFDVNIIGAALKNCNVVYSEKVE
jgi:hypothetical protein